MKTKKSVQIATGLCVALLFCRPSLAQQTTYNFMPGTDFSQFRTFKWVTIPGGVHPNQIVNREIRIAVVLQLISKGLTQTASDDADLYVGYEVALDQEKQWTAFAMGAFGFGGTGEASSSTISNGTLVVDIFSTTNKELVWTGEATKTLSAGKNQPRTLNKAVAKMMRNFPPPAR